MTIAEYARLYRLLAERPEYRTSDLGDRIDRAFDPWPIPVIDRALLALADDTDRMCGYAVSVLTRKADRSVLDVLGYLSPERILGMYYALPEPRRRAILRADSVWAYHVGRADWEAVDAAAADLDEFPTGDLSDAFAGRPDLLAEFNEFCRGQERHLEGLPHELTDDEVESVERGRRRSKAIGLAIARGEDPEQAVARLLRDAG